MEADPPSVGLSQMPVTVPNQSLLELAMFALGMIGGDPYRLHTKLTQVPISALIARGYPSRMLYIRYTNSLLEGNWRQSTKNAASRGDELEGIWKVRANWKVTLPIPCANHIPVLDGNNASGDIQTSGISHNEWASVWCF